MFLFSDEYRLPLLPPAIAAVMAATMELTTPPLLVLGLLTRPVAALLLGMTFVIEVFVYPLAWPTHIQWAAMLLVLLFRGGGTVSLDHVLGRWWNKRAVAALILVATSILSAGQARAGETTAAPAIVTIPAAHDFNTMSGRLADAIAANGMLVVAKAFASAAAAKRGIEIPGDAVFLVFRNDFAVRMLAADAAAGIEAPIPIHLMELPGGKTAVAYRRPSDVFRPYRNAALDTMATELGGIFGRIAESATGQ